MDNAIKEDHSPVSYKLVSEVGLRIGQLGNNGEIWDNGFYTRGYIGNLPIDILIDNGSTSTLLSNKVYKELLESSKIKNKLRHSECKLYDVNGIELQLYGVIQQSLQLGSATFDQNFLVCNIDKMQY